MTTLTQAFNTAITNRDNFDSNGIIWNFIDADCYIDARGTFDTDDEFYDAFNELCETYERNI